ncbi:OmpH family outer membrane protein [Elusimicrobiota bacterium]
MVFYIRRYFLKFFRIKCIFFLVSLICTVPVFSVMITSNRIAYVNIEKVYSEILQVKDARDDLAGLINEKKHQIEELERAIESIRSRITGEDKQTQQNPSEAVDLPGIGLDDPQDDQNNSDNVSVTEEKVIQEKTSTEDTVGEKKQQQGYKALNLPDFELEEFGKQLKKKEVELRQLMLESKKLISMKEQEYKHMILGNIYETVRTIASKGGYTLIVDKDIVLFSESSVVDITGEVIRNLDEARK